MVGKILPLLALRHQTSRVNKYKMAVDVVDTKKGRLKTSAAIFVKTSKVIFAKNIKTESKPHGKKILRHPRLSCD